MLRTAKRFRLQARRAARLPAMRPLSKLYVMSTPPSNSSSKDSTQPPAAQLAAPPVTVSPSLGQTNNVPASNSQQSVQSSDAQSAASSSGKSDIGASQTNRHKGEQKQQQSQSQQQQQQQQQQSSPLKMLDRASWLFLLFAAFGVGVMRPRYAQRALLRERALLSAPHFNSQETLRRMRSTAKRNQQQHPRKMSPRDRSS